MRITKIALQGFRAFDEHFELDLSGGKNLLLHGENGAGKSSIYLALNRFFEELGDDLSTHRNLFSPATRNTEVKFHFLGKDAVGGDIDGSFVWASGIDHPLVPPDANPTGIGPHVRTALVAGARRAGFLDYRAMLRTHLQSGPLPRSNSATGVSSAIYPPPQTGLFQQLFDLISLVILSGVRVTVAGGGVTTIGALARNVWRRRPYGRYKNVMADANLHANAFNTAFNSILPDLEARVSELLLMFPELQMSVKFNPVSLAWDKPSLMLNGAEFIPEVTFRGALLTDPQSILNEARLSALATCIFLGGVLLADSDAENPDHPRFLVLDDALIGLELQNRLPVLRILTNPKFTNYQIILMTHDQVWFELARGHLPSDKWIHLNLLANEDTGVLIPICKPRQGDLAIAHSHLANGDLKAAAVYARSAFEWRVRNVCESKGIKTPFKADPKDAKVGALWDAVMERQQERVVARANGSVVNDFVPPVLAASVATMRSTVLNRLSHAGAAGLVAAEVQTALQTVADVIAHPFPNAT